MATLSSARIDTDCPVCAMRIDLDILCDSCLNAVSWARHRAAVQIAQVAVHANELRQLDHLPPITPEMRERCEGVFVSGCLLCSSRFRPRFIPVAFTLTNCSDSSSSIMMLYSFITCSLWPSHDLLLSFASSLFHRFVQLAALEHLQVRVAQLEQEERELAAALAADEDELVRLGGEPRMAWGGGQWVVVLESKREDFSFLFFTLFSFFLPFTFPSEAQKLDAARHTLLMRSALQLKLAEEQLVEQAVRSLFCSLFCSSVFCISL